MPSSEAPQGRVQLWPELHGGGHRPHAPRQALHDEPRPERVLRLLLPQPWVHPACVECPAFMTYPCQIMSEIKCWLLNTMIYIQLCLVSPGATLCAAVCGGGWSKAPPPPGRGGASHDQSHDQADDQWWPVSCVSPPQEPLLRHPIVLGWHTGPSNLLEQ